MKDSRRQNESALVCIARQGDREALQTLLGCNWAWLRGLVYSVLADTQDLDDAMQEICLRVITRIHTLREPDRFRAWLAVLARRVALKYARRRWHGPIPPDELPAPDPPDGYAGDPAEVIERRELCGRIREAVQRLPQKYREVAVLAHTGELTYAQMAEVLDIPITTMQIRLVRARRMIRNQIAARSEHKVHEK